MTDRRGDRRGEHLGDLLSALLDGELARSDEEQAYRHLEACRLCASELADVRTARGLVRALPAVDPPFGFFEGLVLGDHQPPSRRVPLRRRVGVAALAASAAAAVAVVGLAPPRGEPVSPSVARLVEAHATGASLDGDPLSRLAPLGVPVTFRQMTGR